MFFCHKDVIFKFSFVFCFVKLRFLSFLGCVVCSVFWVVQEALEGHDGVSKGKYTIGLGQDCMAFCSEVEDVISMRLVTTLHK